MCGYLKVGEVNNQSLAVNRGSRRSFKTLAVALVDLKPVKMQKSMLALGLDGIKLTDTDIFSLSDPYVVISRQRRKEDGGQWTPIRISETIKVNR